MANTDIDFEGTGIQGHSSDTVTDTSDKNDVTNTQDDVTNLNGGGAEDVTGKDGNSDKETNTDDTNTDDNNSSTGELVLLTILMWLYNQIN